MVERRKRKASGSGKKSLINKLHDSWIIIQPKINKKFKRTLPLGEYVIDRWEKANLLGFGEGSSIYDSSLVMGDVKVGAYTWIGPFTILDGSGGGLQIGDFCSISAGVHIYTHDTVRWAISGARLEPEKAPTKIGSRCYIGPNTVIVKGVIIGDGCIIGANSFVDRNIPPNSKAWGNPVRIIGSAQNLE